MCLNHGPCSQPRGDIIRKNIINYAIEFLHRDLNTNGTEKKLISLYLKDLFLGHSIVVVTKNLHMERYYTPEITFFVDKGVYEAKKWFDFLLIKRCI